MTGDTPLSSYVSDDDELTAVDDTGELYRIRRSRTAGFDDEVLFVRMLSSEDAYEWEELREEDVRHLEREFYDDDTPNRWNIQLFWAYEDGVELDEETRRKLEGESRFAIRRCVPRDSLEGFLRPLECSRERLDEVSEDFGRDALVQRVIGNGLGFLLDQNTSHDEKFERLLEVDTDSASDPGDVSSVSTTAERPSYIDEVELGQFRSEASRRQLDLEPFTLLYGRNGAGKTSLLDGITMGLVGQTRRGDNRISAYDELGVTLEGDNGPLPTDSESVNDRVADWFGFRPEGPAQRYVEFYRVNYHEAGETTRLLEESAEPEIERVFENFLYGEDLAYAKKEKDRLIDRLRREVDNTEDDISDHETKIERLQDKKKRAKETLSALGSAKRDLSPAATALVAGDGKESETAVGETGDDADNSGSAEETLQERIARWHGWQRRFERIEAAIHATTFDWNTQTARELRSKLKEEVRIIEETKTNFETIQTLKNGRSRITDLTRHIGSEGIDELQFSTFFSGLLLATAGEMTRDDIYRVTEAIEETELELGEMNSVQSVESWFDTIETELQDRRAELSETRSKLEELNNLMQRRRELREQIRADTEEYLEITDDEDIEYCPACYVEQSADDIRTREEPEHTHDTDGVPSELTASLEVVEEALGVVEKVDTAAVDDDLNRYGRHLCDPSDVVQLFETVADGREAVLFEDVTASIVETVARLAQSQTIGERSADDVLSAILAETEDDIEDQVSSVPDYDSETEVQQQIDECSRRVSDVRSGLDVLEEQWPDELLDDRLRVESDRRTIADAVENAKADAAAEPLSELSGEIEKTESDIEDLSKRIDTLRRAQEHLKSVFSGVEDSLGKVLERYTDVVTTLFQVFQRPYEFEQIDLTGDNELRVVRRSTSEEVGIADMSAGQRTALALAIFVTNNLAHDTAPPVMLLDEPFAHLDELNTLSFFNLVIELAVRGDRQIVFATANDNLASLLEQKVGETDAFDRVDLEVR